ncbi:hypothetical protein CcaCcLH18_14283 [Colletotrichum camelliae]|nr:hypothetical protein CcaCcLH18_14283 [Colletotrichum camelliae]
MRFLLIIPARELSKAELDDLIRETKVNEIKGDKYSDLVYTDKKTRVKFQYKYLRETTNDAELYSLEIDMAMIEAIDNDPDACDYFTYFLETAKAA